MKKIKQQYLYSILFGSIFGFLLQKGGVTKYHVLEGQLLLQDWTVAKVMLSAITVGMVGFFLLHRRGKVKPSIKPAQIAANTLGGLIFGVGFAFAGYCPGTGAAALGQGSFSAIYFMSGMVIGSYLYAEFSKKLSHSLQKVLNKGKITLPEFFNIRRSFFVSVFSTVLVVIVIFLS